MHRLFSRTRAQAAFTLAELMVAAGVFAVGASIAYPLLINDLNLYTRNFSINKSSTSLRHGLQVLKNDIDMAIDPPTLMSYSVSGTTTTLTPVTAGGTSAEAMIMWVNIGPAYDLVPTAGTGTKGAIDPTGVITIGRHVYSAGDLTPTSPLPLVGDRLIIIDPLPFVTGMPETVNGVLKPGREIASVSSAGASATQFTIRLNRGNTLPAGILGDKVVYIAREVAYVAKTITVGTTAVERQLVYYPSTYDMTKSKIIIRDLDPTPQTPDATSNSTLAFNYPSGGRSKSSMLGVNLPIRALDYSRAIGDRDMGGQTVDASSKEFYLFLRSNPTMGVRSSLD